MQARPLILALASITIAGAVGYLMRPHETASPFEAGDATIHAHRAHQGATSTERGDGKPPKAPNPYFFAERAFPLDAIPLERRQVGLAEAAALKAQAFRGGSAWTFRGPDNVGGRVTDLAVHPTDADIVYAGAAEGGVLKTTNGGTTWTPIFDDQPALSVGDVTLDPQNPNVVYVGTGEVNPGGGSVAYGGLGVFRSTDAGSSWSSLGLEATSSIGRIVIDPTDSDRIFVAATGRLWATNPERGVYRSTDGGSNWDRVLYVADDAGCVDLVMRPDDPDVLFAAIWQRLRQPEVYDYGGPLCAVYKSTDGGDSWSIVGGGLKTPSNNSGRIGISLSAQNPDYMHVVYADRTGFFDGLYRSTNGGTSWNRTNDGALSDVFSSFGWWFGNCRTHPTNPDVVFVQGLDFYRTTNGGASWNSAGGSMHVDHHALEFGPGSSPVIYAGNDGGIYRSVNGGTAWSFVGNQPIGQFYRVALDAQNPASLLGGMQDNGTQRTLGPIDGYSSLFGGDGFEPLVHPTNANRIWVQFQYGNLYYSSNGGNSFNGALGGISGSDRKAWNSPIEQDPTDPDRRFYGTHRVYESVSSTSWTAISGDLTGGPRLGNSGQVNGVLTTIEASPLNGDIIWTGSDDGYIQVTTNGGSNWTRRDSGIPERWITSVHPDPLDSDAAMTTVSGFRWDETLPRVYRTTDLGVSWQEVQGNLPDAPANDVWMDPMAADHYVVATDVGVFETFDGGALWGALGVGLPNVVVNDFAYDDDTRTLIAGTYGRSIFSIELDDPASVDPEPIGQDRFALAAPRPNPTSGPATLSWQSATDGKGRVEIYSVAGRRVQSLDVSWRAQEPASVEWNGVDEAGRAVESGVYFVRLTSDDGLRAEQRIIVRR